MRHIIMLSKTKNILNLMFIISHTVCVPLMQNLLKRKRESQGKSIPFTISISHALVGVRRVEGDHHLCSHQEGDPMSPIPTGTLYISEVEVDERID